MDMLDVTRMAWIRECPVARGVRAAESYGRGAEKLEGAVERTTTRTEEDFQILALFWTALQVKRFCADCNPCPHGKLKSKCADCNPCPHGKLKSKCADCNPWPHGKLKYDCSTNPRSSPIPEFKREPSTVRGFSVSATRDETRRSRRSRRTETTFTPSIHGTLVV